MNAEQHAKVLEALELGHAAYPRFSTESTAIAEALSIMRAAKPSRYGAFYGCAYCQGGAGMGGDGCHIDENGLRVRCPNAIILGDISAPPTEHEVKP